MRNKLDCTTTVVRDLVDQARGPGTLFMLGPYGDRQAYAVSRVDVIHVDGTPSLIEAHLHKDLVTSFTPGLPWQYVNEPYLEHLTVREMITKAAADGKAVEELYESLKVDALPEEAPTKLPTLPSYGHYV